MRKKELLKHISKARNKVQSEITAYVQSYDSKYVRGLASEGYNGGYRDALDDVMLLLNDVRPTRHDFWDD